MVHAAATPRELRREETSERILVAAKLLIAEGGYESLTMSKLAKALGYRAGALYRYFDSKDAIVFALQRRAAETILADIEQSSQAVLTAAVDSPSLTSIVANAFAYASLSSRRPTEFRLISLSVGDPRELLSTEAAKGAEGVVPALSKVLAHVAGHYVRAEAEGALRSGDATLRTVVLWGALHGVMQLEKLERFGILPTGRVEALLTDLLVGAGATPLAVTNALAHRSTFIDALPSD